MYFKYKNHFLAFKIVRIVFLVKVPKIKFSYLFHNAHFYNSFLIYTLSLIGLITF